MIDVQKCLAPGAVVRVLSEKLGATEKSQKKVWRYGRIKKLYKRFAAVEFSCGIVEYFLYCDLNCVKGGKLNG